VTCVEPGCSPRVFDPISTTSGAVAGETADDDIEDSYNAADDGLEDGANGVDYGHEATANGLEDALNTRDDGTHFECVVVVWGRFGLDVSFEAVMLEKL